ncbi:MAG: hypothetical protein HC925_08695 [Coleofasciculaceae cyanobacterium SM2_3_26]|nr:hypothetical protein [Coleofasciculaceae cyanobacterium SM2_3_26]
MSSELENELLKELRRLKQKKKQQQRNRMGIAVAIAAGILGCGCLAALGVLQWSYALALGIMGIAFALGWFAHISKHQVSKNQVLKARSDSSKTSEKSERLPKIQRKYIVGYGLLILAIACQYNPSLILTPIDSFFTRFRYNPQPALESSPWAWTNNATLHPAVTNMPPEAEQSIQSVANYIAQQEPDPYLRVKALHDYVISRITYDLKVLETGIRPAQDAQTVFKTRKGVCEGYANLFAALGKAIDMDVAYVGGRIRRDLAPIELIPKTIRFMRSDYDWTLHAWNAVKIADNWYLVDTTWDDSDSAEADSVYRADYLMPPPEVMIVSHFPDRPSWQLLSQPKNQTTFEQQPILMPQFFAEGLTLISPSQYETSAKNVAAIEVQSAPNYQKTIGAIFTKAQASEVTVWDFLPSRNGEQENGSAEAEVKQCEGMRNQAGNVQIFCQFPEPGTYEVLLFSFGQENIDPIGQLKVRAL